MRWIYNLLGTLLSFFDRITGSYALALLFYALIFKIVFLPFAIKQQKNQIAMAKLAPKIELIKAKYKGRTDQKTQQKQQQEIMELQQKEGYNAMAGCLPLLLQLPLIMLLYTVIQNPLSYIAKPTNDVQIYNEMVSSESYTVDQIPESLVTAYGDVIIKYDADGNKTLTRAEITNEMIVEKIKKDLIGDDEESLKATEIQVINSIYHQLDTTPEYKDKLASLGIDYDSIPNFRLFGVNLAEEPKLKVINILTLIPFLAAASSWLSMWLTKKMNNTGLSNPMQDGQNKSSMIIMDLMMPAMTLFIAFRFSGMLGIYWMMQSLLGLLQTFIISKCMPLPRYTEEEIKEINRAKKNAEKEAARVLKEEPKHKSLHYIDEDDYEELPEVKTRDEDDKGGFKSGDVPEIKD